MANKARASRPAQTGGLAMEQMAQATREKPDLCEADLQAFNPSHADLRGADLRNANLCFAHLIDADLSNIRSGRKTNGIGLSLAEQNGTDLSGVDPNCANQRNTNLTWAHPAGADLRGADLAWARLNGSSRGKRVNRD